MKQRVYIVTFPQSLTTAQEDTMISYLQVSYEAMCKRFDAFSTDLNNLAKLSKIVGQENVALTYAKNQMEATKMSDFFSLDKLSDTTYIFAITEIDFKAFKKEFTLLDRKFDMGVRNLARMNHREKLVMEGFQKDCLPKMGITAFVEERELEG